MAKILLKDVSTTTIPVVDFGCRHGRLASIAEDVFDASCYSEADLDPDSVEEYDAAIRLIQEGYDGTEAFYVQVLRNAGEYIQDAFNEYDIQARVRPGSCEWYIPRSGWYDTAIEFDMEVDAAWVEDTFLELAKDPDFINYVKHTFQSRSGFISYIPDDIEELTEILYERDDYDYWKVVTVIIKYFVEQNESIRDDITYEMIDSILGSPDFETCSSLGIY